MRILLSNDDGYQAKGLVCLAEVLSELAEITVVAPDRNRSGASNSLTLDVPLRLEQVGERSYYVNGTPTDCVHVALTGLLDEDPDMVISGINFGANLGDDVIYSGTVAAATEGRYLGLPAIAVSLVAVQNPLFETAAEVVKRIVLRLIDEPLPRDTILNINVPNLPIDEIKGWRATRLGFRHRSEPVVRAMDPKNRPVFWIGPAGEGQDNGSGTDFRAVDEGYVSVTPIRVDLTDHGAIASIDDWLAAWR